MCLKVWKVWVFGLRVWAQWKSCLEFCVGFSRLQNSSNFSLRPNKRTENRRKIAEGDANFAEGKINNYLLFIIRRSRIINNK